MLHTIKGGGHYIIANNITYVVPVYKKGKDFAIKILFVGGAFLEETYNTEENAEQAKVKLIDLLELA